MSPSENASLVLSGFDTKRLIDSIMAIEVEATWTDSLPANGNIELQNSTILIHGSLSLETASAITMPVPDDSTVNVMRTGLLAKSAGVGTFAIDAPLVNRGGLLVSAGMLLVSNHITQERDGIGEGIPRTRLENLATLQTAGTFAVKEGLVDGNGTIAAAALVELEGGMVHPGMPNDVGTLTINGAFTMGIDAEQIVTVAADGSAGKLIVTGQATLAGGGTHPEPSLHARHDWPESRIPSLRFPGRGLQRVRL